MGSEQVMSTNIKKVKSVNQKRNVKFFDNVRVKIAEKRKEKRNQKEQKKDQLLARKRKIRSLIERINDAKSNGNVAEVNRLSEELTGQISKGKDDIDAVKVASEEEKTVSVAGVEVSVTESDAAEVDVGNHGVPMGGDSVNHAETATAESPKTASTNENDAQNSAAEDMLIGATIAGVGAAVVEDVAPTAVEEVLNDSDDKTKTDIVKDKENGAADVNDVAVAMAAIGAVSEEMTKGAPMGVNETVKAATEMTDNKEVKEKSADKVANADKNEKDSPEKTIDAKEAEKTLNTGNQKRRNFNQIKNTIAKLVKKKGGKIAEVRKSIGEKIKNKYFEKKGKAR